MAETLTVALRVAEEAIDEAIYKAEFNPGSQVIYVLVIDYKDTLNDYKDMLNDHKD